MTFKRLETGIALRLLGLLALLGAAFFAAQRGHYGLGTVAALLLLAAVWELARYLGRSSSALADFLLAVKYRDFAQHYNEATPNQALRPLHAAFNQLNAIFRQLSAEREAQFAYLQTVLQLIDTGIVSYDATGSVEWVNEAFKQTLEMPYLKNIQALQKRRPALYEAICRLRPGEPQVVPLTVADRSLQLLLSATAFKLQGREFTLVAFKNVSEALDETQTEAWQKLLRVMTHEIMNSVAPIASLADSLRRHLEHERAEAAGAAHPLLADLEEGIAIIQHRSEGLLRFAQVYRDFSKITTPHLGPVAVQALFAGVRALLLPQLEAAGTELRTAVEPPELQLQADGSLLEQVLINLVLNAAYAVRDTAQPRIQLRAARTESGRVVMEVADNGCGIPAELFDSIFIPFFTTRRHGTGIGLSLAKQIVHLHRGSIKVQSEEGRGTVFRLEL